MNVYLDKIKYGILYLDNTRKSITQGIEIMKTMFDIIKKVWGCMQSLFYFKKIGVINVGQLHIVRLCNGEYVVKLRDNALQRDFQIGRECSTERDAMMIAINIPWDSPNTQVKWSGIKKEDKGYDNRIYCPYCKINMTITGKRFDTPTIDKFVYLCPSCAKYSSFKLVQGVSPIWLEDENLNPKYELTRGR